MPQLFDLKRRRNEALVKTEAILADAEKAQRQMTSSETANFNTAMREVQELNAQIAPIERSNTLLQQVKNNGGMLIPGGPGSGMHETQQAPMTAEYREAQGNWIRSRGREVSPVLSAGFDPVVGGYKFAGIAYQPVQRSASYEGSNTVGGYAVPSFVEPQIIPLAPPEFGVESICDVIGTVADLKFPRQTAAGTAALKSESGGSNNAFGGSDPTIDQFTLTANMAGHIATASWELLQDVQVFQSFLVQDVLLSLAILKEGYYITGSGSGQPQGLLGNVGAGATGVVADGSGNLLSIQSTFDCMGFLKAYYYNKNTRWLMARATAIELRKAQMQSNLYAPVFTSEGGKDYLHGIEVAYSSSMPAIAPGNTPVLFGDFKAGYIVGIRGGAGVNVKILDQPKANLGLLDILGYQRVDGKVRRSEAIQGITLHT